jgi:hypothetical protein
MKYTTYYIGAGASAGGPGSEQGVPIVSNFNDDLFKILNIIFRYKEYGELRSAYDTIGNEQRILYDKTVAALETDIQWLHKEIRFHRTIDTLAKRFTLTNKFLELNRLKRLLSIYFLFKQFTSPFDIRYDYFLATILQNENGNITWPEDIRIISWNYDLQLEMALCNYHVKNSISSVNHFLQAIPNITYSYNDNEKIISPSLIKLNGIAGPYYDTEGKSFCAVETLDELKHVVVGKVIELYNNIPSQGLTSMIKFAWEDDDNLKFRMNAAREILAQTKKLIIIGYSFPYYNRKTDFELLHRCRMQQIIIQDKYPDLILEKLVRKFTSDNEPAIRRMTKLVDDVSDFRLPED